MTEKSYPWNGSITGDAVYARYDADEWGDMYYAMLSHHDANSGVLSRFGTCCEVTGAATPVTVGIGKAFVHGTFYENDAPVNVVVPVPAANPRYDRIVLRKDWAAQTVRITRIAGIEGGGVPALTQVDGTTWDVPLATAYSTTLGVITLTDDRYLIGTFAEPQRQGSTATDWHHAGANNYDPRAMRMQFGVHGSTAGSSGTYTINFPVAFAHPPIVWATPSKGPLGNNNEYNVVVCIDSVSTTQAVIKWNTHDGSATGDLAINWLAFGAYFD